MEVFFHIVDDARWQQAFFNLAELVADGGRFLFTDQTMNDRTTRARHVRRRTQGDYLRFLETVGFEEPRRFTFTRFTGRDVEGESRMVPQSLAHTVWRCAYNAVRMCPSGTARESIGHAAGRMLYRLDERYSSMQVSAPCLELWLCRKRGGGT